MSLYSYLLDDSMNFYVIGYDWNKASSIAKENGRDDYAFASSGK